MKDNATMSGQKNSTSRRSWLYAAGAAAGLAGAGLAWWRMSPKAPASGAQHEFWGQSFDAPSGDRVTMAAFAGKPLLVNFWATWCAPCQEELPSLQALHEAGDGVVVIGINVKEPLARVSAFVNHAQLSLPVVLDERGELARQWGVRIYPSTVLIAPDGRARWRVVGDLDWNGPQARDWLSALRR